VRGAPKGALAKRARAQRKKKRWAFFSPDFQNFEKNFKKSAIFIKKNLFVSGL